MILIGLYDKQTMELQRSHGPFAQEDVPWDEMRMWQTLWDIVVKIIPHS